jgi:hypothetical protein
MLLRSLLSCCGRCYVIAVVAMLVQLLLSLLCCCSRCYVVAVVAMLLCSLLRHWSPFLSYFSCSLLLQTCLDIIFSWTPYNTFLLTIWKGVGQHRNVKYFSYIWYHKTFSIYFLLSNGFPRAVGLNISTIKQQAILNVSFITDQCWHLSSLAVTASTSVNIRFVITSKSTVIEVCLERHHDGVLLHISKQKFRPISCLCYSKNTSGAIDNLVLGSLARTE